MIVKHGNVLLFEEGGFVLRDIRVENGKIKEIAPELQAAEGEEVFDASGKYVTPGMIAAHSHICISEEGMGSIGDDCCDYSGALTPELEVLDGIYPFDRAVIDSVRAGVTAACVCPGSDHIACNWAIYRNTPNLPLEIRNHCTDCLRSICMHQQLVSSYQCYDCSAYAAATGRTVVLPCSLCI